MNDYFFTNHVSQIETVSVIVHTPITSLFKGAQLINYAVWVLILLCCAATKCPVRQCFYALFTLRCKIEVFFYSFFTQMEEKKISIACFSFRLCWKKSKFFLCVQYLLKKSFYLNLKEWKRISNRRQDSVGNVSWNQCLFFYLQE